MNVILYAFISCTRIHFEPNINETLCKITMWNLLSVRYISRCLNAISSYFRFTGGGRMPTELNQIDSKIISIIGEANPSIMGVMSGFDSMYTTEETQAAVLAIQSLNDNVEESSTYSSSALYDVSSTPTSHPPTKKKSKPTSN